MLGGREFRLRRGFACGKTLVRRKSAAPTYGAPVLSGINALRRGQKETPANRLVFLFCFKMDRPGFNRAGATSGVPFQPFTAWCAG